jgi:VanZ family protein
MDQSQFTISKALLLVFRILFTGFVLWTIWFIFHNSLQEGAISAARSEQVTEAVNRVLERAHHEPVSEYTVRKLAHFSEFMLLGFAYTLCLRVYTRRYIRYVSWPLLLGLLVANLDETIQAYVAGRASSVRDVWIDFGGCCVGVVVSLCLMLLIGALFVLAGFGRPHLHPPEEGRRVR